MTTTLAGLDFETSCSKCGSICQVGIALLNDDGTTVERREWLVRPHPSCADFSPFCTAVHGLTWKDVRLSPEFPEIWPDMLQCLSQADIVIAHNAAFDMRQLKAALTLYHIQHTVTFQYACTLCITRHLYPELPSHKLDAVADYFGHRFRHHDALEDAEACAFIASQTGIPDNYKRQFRFDATTSA